MYGAVALRILVAVALSIVTLLSRSSNIYLVLLVGIGVFAIDVRTILILKNFVIVYILLVFGVGGAVLHMTRQPVFGDIVAYLLAFLAGYAVASMHSTGGRHAGGVRGSSVRGVPGKGALSAASLENAQLLLVTLDLMFLGLQLLKYGLVGYYQGQGLLDQALTYGKANTAGGAEQLLRFGLKYAGITIVILYIRACFESHVKVKYRYPIAILVALPIISLNRFDAVVGALTALAIFASESRLSSRRRPSRDLRVTPPLAPSTKPKMTKGFVIALGMVLAVTTALFVADLRSGFSQTTAPHPNGTLALLTSELSPAQAYGDIKANIHILGHPYGRTIMLPLLFKVVPRAWYPNKPLNSGAYYMSIVRPAEFKAGYALPPTIFGDGYLSFGFQGALLLTLALGILASRLDLGYKCASVRRLPWFLFIFANFYGILRYPISESLAGIMLMLMVWVFANHLFRPKVPGEIFQGANRLGSVSSVHEACLEAER